MAEHKAQERATERPLPEGRMEDDRTAELASRKGGFAQLLREAAPMPEAPGKAPSAKVSQQGGTEAMMSLMQETTRSLRAAMMLPIAPGAGFLEMQEALTELATGMMRNNLRLAQEMLRISGPQDYAGLMQNMMQQWFDSMVESQRMLLQAARHATDQTLRSGETLAEQRARTH
jgi:hypothetical protein